MDVPDPPDGAPRHTAWTPRNVVSFPAGPAGWINGQSIHVDDGAI